MQRSIKPTGPSRWHWLAWIVVLAAGVATGLFVYPRAQAARLQHLVIDAQRCAFAFNLHHLSALSGTRHDLDTAEYLGVKAVLQRLREVDPQVRFTYLMRRVPGTSTVVFLADSEAPASADISLPGDPYPEAEISPGLQHILRTGEPSTEGPLSDSFGTWVTAYAPVRTDEDGSVSEVVGLDIDAHLWARDLWHFTGSLVGGVWFALGLPLVIYRVMRRQSQLTSTIRRLSLALDQSNVAVAIADLKGNLEYVNLGFRRQLGYEREAVLGRSWRDLGIVELDSAQLEQMLEHLRRGCSWHGQWQNRRRDGTVYFARGAVSPVREPGQRRMRFVAVFDDISELMQAEAQLRTAKQQAEEASAAKSQFLAMMSHEIRTPLNGVIGMTSLLRQTALTPDQEESVRVIDSSSEALLSIIDDILNLTKIEAGKMELRRVTFSFRTLVSDTVRLLQPTATAKGIALTHWSEPDIPDWVIGDPGRLRQILLNLLGNAVKFTDEGKVELGVRFRPRDANRGQFIVDVCDTGPGIPSQRQQELFVPFAQLDTSASRRFGGTGLGLVISRRLCEMMHGTISVVSDGSSGSTFTFSVELGLDAGAMDGVPAAKRELEWSSNPAETFAAANARSTADARSRRLLLVEDNAVNALVARRMLGSLGYQPDEARNGVQAIAACRKQAYDVILMDLQMPELDGLAATKAIRALPLPVRPWIIAVTAEAMDGDRDRCLAGGMDGYLSKPLTLARLAEQLAQVPEPACCSADS